MSLILIEFFIIGHENYHQVLTLIMKISEIKLRRFEAILAPLSSKITVVVFEFKYKVTENSDVLLVISLII